MKVELLTNLKHQTTKVLAELHSSKEPVLISEYGQLSAYLVDVKEYESMKRRIELLKGLSLGEQAAFEGRTFSHAEARARMSKWLK